MGCPKSATNVVFFYYLLYKAGWMVTDPPGARLFIRALINIYDFVVQNMKDIKKG
jgi:hypothetical protein